MNLFSILAADLRRARFLYCGNEDNVSGVRLVVGVLSPRFMPVLLLRLSLFFYYCHLNFISKIFSLVNFVIFGLEVAAQCQIGKGIFFPHTSGIVIGAYSIGENVTIFQGVTLGARDIDFKFSSKSRPTIESDVSIGAGAKVLGSITIGAGSRIGANAVVVNSIPPNAVAVGVPAAVIRTNKS